MPNPPNPVPDGIELRKDGSVRLQANGDGWRLRRPKLGEFRKLRELLNEANDDRLRIIARMGMPDKPGNDATADEKLEYTLAVSARSRQLEAEVLALNVAWIAEALRVLCDHDPPEPDDWPSGMDSSDTIAELVQHWRSVPLRSGGG